MAEHLSSSTRPEPISKSNPAAKAPRLLRKPEVLERIGLSNSSLYCFIKKGEFPRQVQLGKRAVAWREDEVEQWIAERLPSQPGGEAQG
ncbi:MAG: AlpA family phage regulatory protein [Desulfobulbaceae bacterium]|nr:AlpA family phage regulatory protein [Desulfobulbaceae bacterium]